MSKRKLVRRVIVVSLCLSTGCATIVTGHGEDQAVRISSTPRGADVIIDDQPQGKTPMSIRLTRHDDHVIKVSKPGYGEYSRIVKSGFNGWILGNIIFGGLIGLAVDLFSGANPSLNPTNIDAKLKADANVPTMTPAPSYPTYPTYPPPAPPAPQPRPTPVAPAPAQPTYTPPPAPQQPAAPQQLAPQQPAQTAPPPYVPPPPRQVPGMSAPQTVPPAR